MNRLLRHGLILLTQESLCYSPSTRAYLPLENMVKTSCFRCLKLNDLYRAEPSFAVGQNSANSMEKYCSAFSPTPSCNGDDPGGLVCWLHPWIYIKVPSNRNKKVSPDFSRLSLEIYSSAVWTLNS